jgi:transcription-repair coupling factor (superfamily II helicase)
MDSKETAKDSMLTNSSSLDLKLIKLISDRLLRFPDNKVKVIGTSSYSLASALATSDIPWDGRRARLLLVPSDSELRPLTECLNFFDPNRKIMELPSFDVNPYSGLYPNPRLAAARVRWLFEAQNAKPGQVFIASMAGLLQKTLPFSLLARTSLIISKGQTLDSNFFKILEGFGYHACSIVDEVGGYSRRGGIVDLFSPSSDQPFRLELFGDDIESIRNFDPESQRSQSDEISEIVILPPHEIIYSEDDLQQTISRFRNMTDGRMVDSADLDAILYSLSQQQYFPGIEFLLSQFYPLAETPLDHFCSPLTIISLDPLEIARSQDIYLESLKDGFKNSPDMALRPNPEDLYSKLETLNWPESRFEIEFSRINFENDDQNQSQSNLAQDIIEYPAPDMVEFRQQAVALMSKPNEQASYVKDKVSHLRDEGFAIFICTHSHSNASRLKVFLEKCSFDSHIIEERKASWDDLRSDQNQNRRLIHLLVGPCPKTTKSNPDKLIFLKDSDFWGSKLGKREHRKEGTLTQRANAITFGDMKPGDFIVHKLHGVGIYEGLKTMPIQGVPTEMIHLRYKDKDSLYLPIYRIGQIQKYSGPTNPLFIDKLGGTGWEKTKTKVRHHLRDIALELLQLYAKRAQIKRPPFASPDNDYFAFQNAFPYEETDDQLTAIREIEGDLCKDQPMDRLICGDVGFGKTELAMRAAFLAVSSHKQVAIVAPTTVLTFQHTQTFRSRFRNWPINIKPLNRFVSNKETKETLIDLASGKIDIIIGTHRLLSKDVKFRELGLIILDEEQKFGVRHKEALRKMKASVDTLALSATPIPRTLNMSLMGIRDLSLLSTPPLDRLPTRTFVCKFDKETIRKAILAEVSRGGQIFFIHNRIQSIYGLSDELRQIVPEVRMAVAHGQMDEDNLEKTMVRFFNHEIDMLLCTTIIESGMDIPRANTMFIDRADQFGLSQLYQLRGRVGRSKERAYCYLLIPPHRRLDPEAQERLRVLQENTSLGSGIKIAHYDLELRGAGDLLGEDQSGHINAVGYEFYMELMEDAIRAAKGEPEKANEIDPEINLRIPAYIPDKYIPDIRVRLYYYKALTEISSPEDLERLEDELRDQFGKPPDEVLNLLGVMLIRKMCCDLGIRDISAGPKRLSLAFTDNTPLPVVRVIELTTRENKKFSLTPDSRLVIRMNNISWPAICDELNLLSGMCPKNTFH